MVRNEISDTELIARYVHTDPDRFEPDRGRLERTGVSAWVLISQLRHGDSFETVASDYDITIDEVQAAVAYYRQHPAVIDARITLNEAAVEDA